MIEGIDPVELLVFAVVFLAFLAAIYAAEMAKEKTE